MNHCVLCGWPDTDPKTGLPNPYPHPRPCRATLDGHHRPTQNWRAESPSRICAACGEKA